MNWIEAACEKCNNLLKHTYINERERIPDAAVTSRNDVSAMQKMINIGRLMRDDVIVVKYVVNNCSVVLVLAENSPTQRPLSLSLSLFSRHWSPPDILFICQAVRPKVMGKS